jgi:hypothetical protein
VEVNADIRHLCSCGKPSKGCSECRKRKTRCDQKVDGCGQCAKAGRVCPGYRAQIDVIFRDQSAGVISKAKASEAKKALASASAPPSAPRVLSQPKPDVEAEEAEEVTELPPSTLLVDSGWTILPTLDEVSISVHSNENCVLERQGDDSC